MEIEFKKLTIPLKLQQFIRLKDITIKIMEQQGYR
jgi:hypothetical protein